MNSIRNLALEKGTELFLIKENIKSKLKRKLACERGNSNFDDGGSTGWIKGQFTSVVFIIILIALVSPFLPEAFTKFKTWFFGLFS